MTLNHYKTQGTLTRFQGSLPVQMPGYCKPSDKPPGLISTEETVRGWDVAAGRRHTGSQLGSSPP